MSKNPHSLFLLSAVLVALIIAGAVALSGEAVMENLRFIDATNQIFQLYGMVYTTASGQKGFAQNPGEDIWADLEHAGQIAAAQSHPNPWHSELHAVVVNASAMRIQTTMPTRDCRRLSLYFLARQPADLGLLAIQAQPNADGPWNQIYPIAAAHKNDTVVESACGASPYADVSLIFRTR